MVRKTVAASIVLYLLQACAVGPDYAEPMPELGDSFAEIVEGIYTSEPVEANLWASFGDPDLDALIDRALGENRTIAQALATLNETRALGGLAIYSWFPTVDIGISQERSQQSPSDPFGPPGGAGETEVYRAGFDMTWEIDLFGSLARQRQAIQQRVEADTAAFAATRLSIIAEVAQTYFSLRGAQQRLRVQEENLRLLADGVQILEDSLQAGRGTSLDVARQRALERSLAAQLPRSRAAVIRAEQRLAVLTAQPVEDLRAQLTAQRDLPEVPGMIAVGTPADWLRRRPDVLVYGHTHTALLEQHGETLHLNPGYAGSPEPSRQRSVAVLDLETLSAQIERLPPDSEPSA